MSLNIVTKPAVMKEYVQRQPDEGFALHNSDSLIRLLRFT